MSFGQSHVTQATFDHIRMTTQVSNPTAQFPVLDRPPIIEVMCGFIFEPLALDGLVLGVYWDRRRDKFPEGSLQPALADRPEVVLGNPPMRAFLTSVDTSRIIQVQNDRLYINWRATGATYPRFSTESGLLKEALYEFSQLAEFCEERFGTRPRPTRIELAKIDLFDRRKQHWSDLADLARLIPVTGTLSAIHYTGSREFSLRFGEHDAPRALHISINSIAERTGGEVVAVRLESRAVHPLAPDQDIQSAFGEANVAVNRAFFALLGPSELARFRLKESDAS